MKRKLPQITKEFVPQEPFEYIHPPLTESDDDSPPAKKGMTSKKTPQRSTTGKLDRMVQKASTQKKGFYEEKGALKQANLTRDLTDADVGVDVDLTVAKLPLPGSMNFEEKYNEMLLNISKLFK